MNGVEPDHYGGNWECLRFKTFLKPSSSFISVVPDGKGCIVPHVNPGDNGHKRKVIHECPCDTIR